MKLSITESAYLAGLFEGEACFTFTSTGYPRIVLNMCDLDIMTYVADKFNVRLHHRPQSNPNHQDQWQLHICKKQVVYDTILQLLPYMGVRRSKRFHEFITYFTDKGLKPSYL